MFKCKDIFSVELCRIHAESIHLLAWCLCEAPISGNVHWCLWIITYFNGKDHFFTFCFQWVLNIIFRKAGYHGKMKKDWFSLYLVSFRITTPLFKLYILINAGKIENDFWMFKIWLCFLLTIQIEQKDIEIHIYIGIWKWGANSKGAPRFLRPTLIFPTDYSVPRLNTNIYGAETMYSPSKAWSK